MVVRLTLCFSEHTYHAYIEKQPNRSRYVDQCVIAGAEVLDSELLGCDDSITKANNSLLIIQMQKLKLENEDLKKKLSKFDGVRSHPLHKSYPTKTMAELDELWEKDYKDDGDGYCNYGPGREKNG